MVVANSAVPPLLGTHRGVQNYSLNIQNSAPNNTSVFQRTKRRQGSNILKKVTELKGQIPRPKCLLQGHRWLRTWGCYLCFHLWLLPYPCSHYGKFPGTAKLNDLPKASQSPTTGRGEVTLHSATSPCVYACLVLECEPQIFSYYQDVPKDQTPNKPPSERLEEELESSRNRCSVLRVMPGITDTQPRILFSFVVILLFYANEHFFAWVYAPHAWLVQVEVRRRHEIHRQLWASSGCWDSNLGSLQEKWFFHFWGWGSIHTHTISTHVYIHI